MPQVTTIKVPIDVRDRLASVAKIRGVTMRGLLDELSRRALDATLLHEGGEWEERTVERLDP
jgi:hypothetical protein